MKFLAACAAPGSSSNRARDPQEVRVRADRTNHGGVAALLERCVHPAPALGPSATWSGAPGEEQEQRGTPHVDRGKRVTKGQSGLWLKGQGAAQRTGGRLEDEIRMQSTGARRRHPGANGAPEGSRAQLIKRWCSSKITSSSSPRSTSRSPSYMTTPVSHW